LLHAIAIDYAVILLMMPLRHYCHTPFRHFDFHYAIIFMPLPFLRYAIIDDFIDASPFRLRFHFAIADAIISPPPLLMPPPFRHFRRRQRLKLLLFHAAIISPLRFRWLSRCCLMFSFSATIAFSAYFRHYSSHYAISLILPAEY
jgi:hypothetical protein